MHHRKHQLCTTGVQPCPVVLEVKTQLVTRHRGKGEGIMCRILAFSVDDLEVAQAVVQSICWVVFVNENRLEQFLARKAANFLNVGQSNPAVRLLFCLLKLECMQPL